MSSHRIWLVLGMALVRCRTSEPVPFHPAGPLAGRQPALTFSNQRTTHFPAQTAPVAAMLRDRRAGTMARYTRDREDMAKTLSFLRKLDDIYSQISRPRFGKRTPASQSTPFSSYAQEQNRDYWSQPQLREPQAQHGDFGGSQTRERALAGRLFSGWRPESRPSDDVTAL